MMKLKYEVLHKPQRYDCSIEIDFLTNFIAKTLVIATGNLQRHEG